MTGPIFRWLPYERQLLIGHDTQSSFFRQLGLAVWLKGPHLLYGSGICLAFSRYQLIDRVGTLSETVEGVCHITRNYYRNLRHELTALRHYHPEVPQFNMARFQLKPSEVPFVAFIP